MADSLGRVVLELGTDSTSFDKGLDAAEDRVHGLGAEFDALKARLRANDDEFRRLTSTLTSGAIPSAQQYVKAVEAIGGADRLTEAEQRRVNAALTEALAKYKALGTEAPAEMQKLAEATKEIPKQQSAYEQLTGALDKVGLSLGTLGVGAAVTGLVKVGKEAVDAGGKLTDLRDATGLSIQQLQRLEVAGAASGISLEQAARGVQMLQKNISGDSGAQKALKDLGFDIRQLLDMDPGEMFETVARRIGEIENPTKRTAVAMEVLGRQGGEMLPLLLTNIDEVNQGVHKMADESAEAFDQWGDNWEKAKISARNALGDIIFMLASAREATSNTERFVLSGPVGDILAKINDLRRTVSEVKQAIDLLGGKTGVDDAFTSIAKRGNPLASLLDPGPLKTWTEAEAQFNRENKDALAQMQKNISAHEAYRQSVASLADEFRGAKLADEVRKTTDAYTALTAAERKRPEVLERVAAKTKDLVKAGADLSPQLLRVWSAHVSLSDIIPKVTSGTSSLTLATIDGTKAFYAGEAAIIRYGEALDRITKSGSAGTAAITSIVKSLPSLPVFTLDPKVEQQIASSFRNVFKDVFAGLPNVILGAFQGGGNVGQSIGGYLGGSILQGLTGKMTDGVFASGIGKALQGVLGKTIGGAIGSIIPGLGTLLGGALGGLIDKIGSIGKNVTKEGRENLAKRLGFGDLGQLYDDLRKAGDAGERLANIGLNVIGKKDREAEARWEQDVLKFYDDLKNKQQQLSSDISSLGLSWLDKTDKRTGFDATFRTLLDQINRLRDDGFDVTKIIGAQADEWNELNQAARQYGFDVPPAMQAILDILADQGVLLDANGEKILGASGKNKAALDKMAADIKAFDDQIASLQQSIADEREEDEMGVVERETRAKIEALKEQREAAQTEYDKLEELSQESADTFEQAHLDALKNIFEQAQTIFAQPIHAAIVYDLPDLPIPSYRPPGFADGTHGNYLDFGRGTPVILHGRERVMTEAEGRAQSAAPSGHTIVFEAGSIQAVDGDSMARIAPEFAHHIIRAIERNDSGGAPVSLKTRIRKVVR